MLVGKTVEQSLLEVMEEEELETLREHQRRFEERRQAELAEQQRLAERERRHVEEKVCVCGDRGAPNLKSTRFSGFLWLNYVICVFPTHFLMLFAVWKDRGSL